MNAARPACRATYESPPPSRGSRSTIAVEAPSESTRPERLQAVAAPRPLEGGEARAMRRGADVVLDDQHAFRRRRSPARRRARGGRRRGAARADDTSASWSVTSGAARRRPSPACEGCSPPRGDRAVERRSSRRARSVGRFVVRLRTLAIHVRRDAVTVGRPSATARSADGERSEDASCAAAPDRSVAVRAARGLVHLDRSAAARRAHEEPARSRADCARWDGGARPSPASTRSCRRPLRGLSQSPTRRSVSGTVARRCRRSRSRRAR